MKNQLKAPTLNLGHSRADRLVLHHGDHVVVDRAQCVVRREAVAVVLAEREQELRLVLVHSVNGCCDLYLIRQFALAILISRFDLQSVGGDVAIDLQRRLARPQLAGDLVQFEHVVRVAAQDSILDESIEA